MVHCHFKPRLEFYVSQRVLSQTVDPGQSEDVLFIDAVTKQGQTDECFSPLNVQGVPIRFKIDTGSQANIIPVSKLQLFQHQPVVTKSATKLTSYSGEELRVMYV